MPGIVWWEIETADPERFMAFHREYSGWTFAADAEESAVVGAAYWTVSEGDTQLGGVQHAASDAPPPTPGVRLFLPTDDLEGSLALAADLGGMMRRPRTIAGSASWYAVFSDPVGVSWGLYTTRPPR